MELMAEEDAFHVPGLGDMGGELADLSAALKFDAVHGDRTDIRRVSSGEAHTEHGRITVRTKPAKTAANRSARRAVREALRRALDGDDVQDVVQRVAKPRFQYHTSMDPNHRAKYEARNESRRRRTKIDVWKAAVETWDAEYQAVTEAKGWIVAGTWRRDNPRPERPILDY
ncbi:MAG: hypothetical protein HGA45_10375 [Chloroflexales bacterium]|nr:hypothetical protein [Chloroflexales bacterium]